jgi:hypothetical protein
VALWSGPHCWFGHEGVAGSRGTLQSALPQGSIVLYKAAGIAEAARARLIADQGTVERVPVDLRVSPAVQTGPEPVIHPGCRLQGAFRRIPTQRCPVDPARQVKLGPRATSTSSYSTRYTPALDSWRAASHPHVGPTWRLRARAPSLAVFVLVWWALRTRNLSESGLAPVWSKCSRLLGGTLQSRTNPLAHRPNFSMCSHHHADCPLSPL